jgi:hypothetical protein
VWQVEYREHNSVDGSGGGAAIECAGQRADELLDRTVQLLKILSHLRCGSPLEQIFAPVCQQQSSVGRVLDAEVVDGHRCRHGRRHRLLELRGVEERLLRAADRTDPYPGQEIVA